MCLLTVRTSVLSEQLRQELSEKRMLFSKNELELSSTVGQGLLATYLSCCNLYDVYFIFLKENQDRCTRDI